MYCHIKHKLMSVMSKYYLYLTLTSVLINITECLECKSCIPENNELTPEAPVAKIIIPNQGAKHSHVLNPEIAEEKREQAERPKGGPVLRFFDGEPDERLPDELVANIAVRLGVLSLSCLLQTSNALGQRIKEPELLPCN